MGLSAFIWFLVWLFYSVVIGLRHEVGGDWYSYLDHFYIRQSSSLHEVLSASDPGYYLINFLISSAGGGIHGVNFVCGAIVMAGVVRFAKNQPLPWLTLVVAVPYLVLVVAMGYTRQSAALGFLLLGLVSLRKKNLRQFVFWVVLGATFHKSVVLMLPVAALSSTRNRIWNLIWVGVISLIVAYLFVFDSASDLWANYVEAEYESQGGLIRILMNAIPALIFLSVRRRLLLDDAEIKLWSWISIFALACIPLVILSSTATDRVALYLIPLQLFVFSRIHLLANTAYARSLMVFSVILYYGFVQLVWLLFASHAHAWLPYQMYPFAS